jgi:hypothetical protein
MHFLDAPMFSQASALRDRARTPEGAVCGAERLDARRETGQALSREAASAEAQSVAMASKQATQDQRVACRTKDQICNGRDSSATGGESP